MVASENVEKIKKEIDAFHSKKVSIERQFKLQKKALYGIYESVSGDINAF